MPISLANRIPNVTARVGILLLAILPLAANAATPYYSVWANPIGNAANQSVVAVAPDATGAVYALANVTGVVTVGSCGALGGSGATSDVFLTRYDSSGNCLWSNPFAGNQTQTGVGAAANSTGVIIIGNFTGNINFGTGPLLSQGGADVFLARFSALGQIVWSEEAGGASTDTPTGVAIDSSGNVSLIGDTNGTFTLGTQSMTSAGGTDGFLVSVNPSGSAQWLRSFSGLGTQIPLGVATDASNNVIVSGAFQQSMDLGLGPLTSQGGFDIFLTKFDSNGNTLWSESFGSSGDDIGYAVATDSSSNIWLCGSYQGTISIGSTILTSQAATGYFVAKFGAGGQPLWAVDAEVGSTTASAPCSLAVGTNNRGYVGLSLSGSGTAFGLPFSSAGSTDSFVGAIQGSDGSYLGYSSVGSNGADNVLSVAIDPTGRIVSGGFFSGTSIDFGAGPVANQGGMDGYIYIEVDDRIFASEFE